MPLSVIVKLRVIFDNLRSSSTVNVLNVDCRRCCYPSPTSVRSVAGLIESNKKLNEKILEINEFYSLHQERIYFCHFLPPQPFLFSTRSNVFCICQMDRNKVQQKCVFVGAIAKYCFGLMWKSFKANIKIFFSISCKIDESIKQWIITN